MAPIKRPGKGTLIIKFAPERDKTHVFLKI